MIHDPQTELAPEMEALTPRGEILIIDDDRDQTDVLAHRLQKLGFTAATANEGRSGLRKAHTQHPDLVLLDLNLPDIDGFEVCREIADSPDTCGMPVIVISGKDGENIVRDCRAAGSEFFIRKPYDPNVLLAVIEQAIGW